jgi:serine/threonine protein kinase
MEIAYAEYKLMMSLNHPNIVKMYDAFFNQMTETMYLVMEYIEGLSLTKAV